MRKPASQIGTPPRRAGGEIRKGAKKRNPLLPLLIAVLFLSVVLVLLVILLGRTSMEESPAPASSAGFSFLPAGETKTGEDISEIPSDTLKIWKDELYSTNAILINNTTGTILGVKDAYDRIYPASITKVMTALIALESLPDLTEKVVISREMFAYITEQNASVAGFSPEESVSVRDLLYGLLLPSGADAAIALAMRIAGNEAAFAERMNEKAAQIGMTGTHFVNCTGLHDEGHYSTCFDLMLLLRCALKNATFRRITSTETYTTASTSAHPGGLILTNTLFSALRASGKNNNYIAGGKTGYTLEAHQCLASYAEIESSEYILVTVGAGQTNKKKQEHILDALYVYSGSFR